MNSSSSRKGTICRVLLLFMISVSVLVDFICSPNCLRFICLRIINFGISSFSTVSICVDGLCLHSARCMYAVVFTSLLELPSRSHRFLASWFLVSWRLMRLIWLQLREGLDSWSLHPGQHTEPLSSLEFFNVDWSRATNVRCVGDITHMLPLLNFSRIQFLSFSIGHRFFAVYDGSYVYTAIR